MESGYTERILSPYLAQRFPSHFFQVGSIKHLDFVIQIEITIGAKGIHGILTNQGLLHAVILQIAFGN